MDYIDCIALACFSLAALFSGGVVVSALALEQDPKRDLLYSAGAAGVLLLPAMAFASIVAIPIAVHVLDK